LKVHWTNKAQQHLVEIYEYIATDSEVYASRMVDRLTKRSKQIKEFPRSGREVPEYDHPDVREVIEGTYRIVYRIKQEQIDILAVIHSSQQFSFGD